MNAAKIKSKGIKTFQTKKIKVGEIEINYAEAGRGKTLILVHGWTNNWTGFIPIGLKLKDKYKVIILDLPGYGDSGRLPKYDFDIQANYLKMFLEKLKIIKPMLIGHSMGTYVVSTLYSKYPNIAENIILIAPVFRHNNKTKRLKMAEWLFKAAKKMRWSTRVIRGIVNTYQFSYFTSRYVNMYKFDKSLVDTYGIEGKRKVTDTAYMDLGVEIAKTNVDDLIVNNKIPIGLIFGKYDRLTNAKVAHNLLDNKGKYRIETVNNAGHLVTVEKPLGTVKAIERLLN